MLANVRYCQQSLNKTVFMKKWQNSYILQMIITWTLLLHGCCRKVIRLRRYKKQTMIYKSFCQHINIKFSGEVIKIIFKAKYYHMLSKQYVNLSLNYINESLFLNNHSSSILWWFTWLRTESLNYWVILIFGFKSHPSFLSLGSFHVWFILKKSVGLAFWTSINSFPRKIFLIFTIFNINC